MYELDEKWGTTFIVLSITRCVRPVVSIAGVFKGRGYRMILHNGNESNEILSSFEGGNLTRIIISNSLI